MPTETKKKGLIGYRKVFITVLVLIMALVLVFMDKLSGDTFMTWITANLGLYMLGNVGVAQSNK